MSQPLVISVILNTNRCADTLECLESLQANDYTNHYAIVLDNASSDGSVEFIRSRFPIVQIIELKANLGYAGNNNVGIQAAVDQGADWIFVLNEDTILSPDCISSLIEVAENSPRIGVVGPMVYHHDEPNVIQSAGGSIGPSWESAHLAENESDIGQFQQARKVDWISGCGIMVRRTLIEEVGMIDARYFYYWEETEWCLRAARAGWSIMHVPAARLWHKGVTRNYRPKPLVTYYSTRNRLLTLAKHKAPVVTWIRAWTQILRTLTSWTVKPRWRFMHEHRHAMWRGVVDFILQRWGGPVQL